MHIRHVIVFPPLPLGRLVLITAVLCSLAMSAATAAPADAAAELPRNIVRNGDFESIRNGRAEHWGWGPHVDLATQGTNHWLRLRGSDVASSQVISLRPEWWKIVLEMRLRTSGVVRGKESWQDARLAMAFYDADGKRVGSWPTVFHAVGDTEWTLCRREYDIPWDAVELRLNPANFGRAGTVEFDDIRIAVTALRPPEPADAVLPAGCRPPWNPDEVWSRTNARRGRMCLNGLWRFAPVVDERYIEIPPPEGKGWWGWFKVPGIWPNQLLPEASGTAQEIRLSPWFFRLTDKRTFDQAWYRRTFTVPAAWKGRRFFLDPGLVQTHARVRVDGRDVGEVWFPGGRLELTKAIRPGQEQILDLRVSARPLKAESTSFMAPERVVKRKAEVRWKGLVDDLVLEATPARDAIRSIHVITSVRRKRIAFEFDLDNPDGAVRRARARITRNRKPVREFDFPAAWPSDRGRKPRLEADWPDPALWDTDTPENLYEVVIRLYDARGDLLDESLPVRFGFREFVIRGRDFFLNGSRIHLRALHCRTTTSAADKSCAAGAARTCRRMKQAGFNFLITGNYGFAPGSVSYMHGLLEAADHEGYLISFSLPHVNDYRWNLDDPKLCNRYREVTAWLIHRVWNHPSIVTYAMNHNSCGYAGDQNPLKIDGRYDPDLAAGKTRRAHRAQSLRAADIAAGIDSTRPIYHHESGNLGAMHTINTYLNWAPRRERSNWLEHWAATGVKPVFFVEWGLPHISSWSSYRGPKFIWTSPARQRLWDSEFAAAIKGGRAYRMTPEKEKSLALEERLWATGKPFYWSQLIRYLQGREEDFLDIQSWFAADNWRAHRAWGISAILPWDQGGLWKRVHDTPPSANPDAFRHLGQPGIVPDRFLSGNQYLDDPGPEANFALTSLGRTFQRWNRPVIAWIAGRPGRFFEQSRNARPGEIIRKQILVLNDSRRAVRCRWRLTTEPADVRCTVGESGALDIAPGDKASLPLGIVIPPGMRGPVRVRADFACGNGIEPQADTMVLRIVPPASTRFPQAVGIRTIRLFDPKGLTTKLFQRLDIPFAAIPSGDIAGLPPAGTLLVIGREALEDTASKLDLSDVPEGLHVLVFEQRAETLTRRFGFRVNVHGLRRVFPRVKSHPVLAGIEAAMLDNWRGAATLTPPFLTLPVVEKHNPTWQWCDFTNTRVWRCGNEGCVASVLIEKPPRGDWTPLVDGGFDLQYAPLLEYREGRGRVMFCQLDVTGRTGDDPAAERICRNLVRYLARPLASSAPPPRRVFVAGDARVRRLLDALGVDAETHYDPAASNALLVLGPGARDIGDLLDAIRGKTGLRVLGLGLSAQDIERHFPGRFSTAVVQDSVAPGSIPTSDDSVWRGISAAELHWRTRLDRTAVRSPDGEGSDALCLVRDKAGMMVLDQVPPWLFDYREKPYLRTTGRRSVFLVARLLANLGAASRTPLLERFRSPPGPWKVFLESGWKGRADPREVGRGKGWSQPGFDDADWFSLQVNGTFEAQRPELKTYDGVVWYRLHFRVPTTFAGKNARLWIGPVDDESWTWLNGRFLGEMTKKTNPDDYWSHPREYTIEPDLLHADGDNVLVVRVNDTFQTGGITRTPFLALPAPWLDSFYVQTPESVDDPYRYFRW